MSGNEKYAKSPKSSPHDLVCCWDCGLQMKQKNIAEHYRKKKLKQDPAHVGKKAEWYKNNQLKFSFGIPSATTSANVT